MQPRLKAACSILLLFLCFRQSVSAQDREAYDLFSAVKLNSEAVESFDLLIESEYFSDSKALGLVERKVSFRIVYDSSLEQGMFLINGRATKFQPGEEKKPAVSTQMMGWRFGDGKSQHRKFPGILGTSAYDDIDAYLTKISVPNPRVLQLLPFGISSSWGKAAEQELWKFQSIVETKSSGKETTAIQSAFETSAPNISRIYAWKIDSHTYEVNSLRLTNRDTATRQEYHELNQIFDWSEVEGVRVPVSIYIENTAAEQLAENKFEEYQETQQYTLHWLKFNSPEVLAGMPGPEVLRDLQEFRNATNLDVLKKYCLTCE